MLCAACGEAVPNTGAAGCPHCGADPLLDGRYRLDAVVGRGAAATTYRALRLHDGVVVAVKEMPLHRARGEKAQALIAREARVLRELSHPAIPRGVDDFSIGAGKQAHLYIVQTFIEGRTLADEGRDKRYSQDEVLGIAEALLDILSYLHGLSPPVIHRDIKPANVLRRPDGSLALIDFGSVRDVLRDAELGGSTVAGTFGYMAPEQFQGDADPRSDLYGVGALAVALLTRKEPRSMLDHNGRIVWEPHVQLHPATIRFLRRMLQPELSRRMPAAHIARAELDQARQALVQAPGLSARPLSEQQVARSLATRQLARPRPDTLDIPELPAVGAAPDALDAAVSAAALALGRRRLFLAAVGAAAIAFGLAAGGGLFFAGAGVTAVSAPVAETPPLRVSPEEGAAELAHAYVRDPGVRACLGDWRAVTATGDEMLAVAIEQRAGSAPVVYLDVGDLDGSALEACLLAVVEGVSWTALDPGLRYHAKFGLPVWDDPEPLAPWPAYSKPPFSEETW